jgi:hypothetical protein
LTANWDLTSVRKKLVRRVPPNGKTIGFVPTSSAAPESKPTLPARCVLLHNFPAPEVVPGWDGLEVHTKVPELAAQFLDALTANKFVFFSQIVNFCLRAQYYVFRLSRVPAKDIESNSKENQAEEIL